MGGRRIPLMIRAVKVSPNLLLRGVARAGLRSGVNAGLGSGSTGLYSGIGGGVWVGGDCVDEGLLIVCTSQLSRACY